MAFDAWDGLPWPSGFAMTMRQVRTMASNNPEEPASDFLNWGNTAVVELVLLLSREQAMRLEALGSSHGLTLAQVIRGIVTDFLARQDRNEAKAQG